AQEKARCAGTSAVCKTIWHSLATLVVLGALRVGEPQLPMRHAKHAEVGLGDPTVHAESIAGSRLVNQIIVDKVASNPDRHDSDQQYQRSRRREVEQPGS